MPLFTRPVPKFASYTYAMIDVPGVVAANNFLSVFNPSDSALFNFPIEVGFTCYSTAVTQVGASLAAYRITAASGGTQVNATDVVKFQTTMPTPKCEIRIGNPTVTRVNNTPVLFKAPVVAGTGGGNSGTVTVSAPIPNEAGFSLFPGEGLVFSTASGSVNELWCIAYSWGELA